MPFHAYIHASLSIRIIITKADVYKAPRRLITPHHYIAAATTLTTMLITHRHGTSPLAAVLKLPPVGAATPVGPVIAAVLLVNGVVVGELSWVTGLPAGTAVPVAFKKSVVGPLVVVGAGTACSVSGGISGVFVVSTGTVAV
jgi:hypothetical protein